MRDLAVIFRALSDETRLFILSLLIRHGELCVCDFEHVLGITQSKSSRHLRYLLNAGLVEDRREGIWVYYCLATDIDRDREIILGAMKPLVSGSRSAALDRKLRAWLSRKRQRVDSC